MEATGPSPEPWEDMMTAPYLVALQKLAGVEVVPFRSRTLLEVPEESGCYVFSSPSGLHECYYVGSSERSERGMRGRLQDHWSTATSSDLSGRLIEEGMARDTGEATDWIRQHVVVRWLTSKDLSPMPAAYLEHFLIAVLRPRFNKPYADF